MTYQGKMFFGERICHICHKLHNILSINRLTTGRYMSHFKISRSICHTFLFICQTYHLPLLQNDQSINLKRLVHEPETISTKTQNNCYQNPKAHIPKQVVLCVVSTSGWHICPPGWHILPYGWHISISQLESTMYLPAVK